MAINTATPRRLGLIATLAAALIGSAPVLALLALVGE